MTGCLEAARVPIERGYGSPDLTGPVLSVTPMPENEPQAVAGYVCDPHADQTMQELREG